MMTPEPDAWVGLALVQGRARSGDRWVTCSLTSTSLTASLATAPVEAKAHAVQMIQPLSFMVLSPEEVVCARWDRATKERPSSDRNVRRWGCLGSRRPEKGDRH